MTLNAVSVHLWLPGYSVAAGEFSGDDEEGEGTGVDGWLQSLVTPCTPLSIIHPLVSVCIQDVTDTDEHEHASEKDVASDSVKCLFFSFLVADFVTGVPKGLMLYGLVREPHVSCHTVLHSTQTQKCSSHVLISREQTAAPFIIALLR